MVQEVSKCFHEELQVRHSFRLAPFVEMGGVLDVRPIFFLQVTVPWNSWWKLSKITNFLKNKWTLNQKKHWTNPEKLLLQSKHQTIVEIWLNVVASSVNFELLFPIYMIPGVRLILASNRFRLALSCEDPAILFALRVLLQCHCVVNTVMWIFTKSQWAPHVFRRAVSGTRPGIMRPPR